MRVSERMRFRVTQDRVENAKQINSDNLEQLSSQKRINRISDDPTAVSQNIKLKNQVGAVTQLQRNINFSRGFIERSETALSGIMDNLIRSKELAVNLSNSTYGPSSREAAAREVKEIISEVISLGDSSYGNRYVFGGFRTETPPISNDGDYLGDDGSIMLQVDKGSFRQINLNARKLFEVSLDEREAGQQGMVKSLQQLYKALDSNDQDQITKTLDQLDHHMDKTSTLQATVGSVYNSLESASRRLEFDKDKITESISKNEDIDLFEASSEFKRTEGVLQSTLLASNKLLQPSLLNFMQ